MTAAGRAGKNQSLQGDPTSGRPTKVNVTVTYALCDNRLCRHLNPSVTDVLYPTGQDYAPGQTRTWEDVASWGGPTPGPVCNR
jgi:hypothetical protein